MELLSWLYESVEETADANARTSETRSALAAQRGIYVCAAGRGMYSTGSTTELILYAS